MAGVAWTLTCVIATCDEIGNLQPNYRSRHEGAKRKRIVCLGNSRDFFGNVSLLQSRLPQLRPSIENCEFLKSPENKSFHRYRTVSGQNGGSCRRTSFTQQDVIYQGGHVGRASPCRFTTDLALRKASSTICCRVHSVEGTEKSYGHDKNLQQQKKLESLKGTPQGRSEIPEVNQQESELSDPSGGNAEEVNSESSAGKMITEPDRKEDAGNPRNGSTSVVSDESSEGSSEVETAVVPPDELQDYGTGGDWEEDFEYVTRISVPRQRYIPVPKVDLVNALLLLFFPANKDASKFLSICSYLEIILHAKHKILLEELRSDYSLTHSVQNGSRVLATRGATNSTKLGTVSTERAQKHEIVGEQADWPLDSSDMEGGSFEGEKRNLLKVLTDLRTKFMTAVKRQHRTYADTDDSSEEDTSSPTSDVEVSEAAAERFQKNFVRILRRAEFEGISLRDLELTAALNSDYLLSTPVDVDWKSTSSSNVKIFRRGYTKEEQKGFLLGEKFDYLQSLALRQAFKKGLAGPLVSAGRWCIQKWNSLWNDKEGRELAESVSDWLQEPLQLENEEPLNASAKPTDHETKQKRELDIPIWLAGRQAIPRYEAILSSAGSRGLLIRRILMRMGLLQLEPPAQTLPTANEIILEPHLRPNHLSRVSMKDIWLPASEAVAGRNVWKRISTAFSVFFSQATLQEPAFKELVLLYNMDANGGSMEAGLQLQTYSRIPLPDLKIVFPSKKLRFRVLDTLRLDVAAIAGLLAFLVNYHFDNFLSSPSAFVLDIIAASALLVLVTRVGFGYKQVWDRYQLLVNRTLYEKTGAKGFGVVQFLVDESEEQQFKEAIIVFTVLVHRGKAEGMTKKQLADSCERFFYYRCKEQVEMPVDSAVRTLLEFGLIVCVNKTSEANSHEGEVRFRALSYEEGLKVLEQHWVSMPSIMALWN